ncbi:MAG: metallophosphoesterase [Clostridia bacterium]|nr:metallophosphoesterase [Clostridia bacterium]
MSDFVSFILRFVCAELILTAIQLSLRKKQTGKGLRAALIIIKLLLAVGLAALAMVGPVALRSVQPMMMAMYVALFADCVSDIIYSIFVSVSHKNRSFAAAKVISVVFGVVYLVFGMVNMQTVRPDYHTYTSDKLSGEHKFVFIADVHVGSAQPFSVTEKTVAAIAAEKPEFTIIGGDLTDDYTTKEELVATAELFGSLDCPVYYIFGNHDRQKHAEKYAGGQKYTPEEFRQILTDAGIIILRDEYAQIAPDLVLLGREDMSEEEERRDIATLPNPSPDAFLLAADHQPFDFKKNTEAGVDLQVSGHTHSGQLFPLGEIYAPFAYCRGEHEYNGGKLYVSPGACGWRVPFRTDSGCRFEVITLNNVK